MRTEIRHNSIVLIPETPQDEVFLEAVLGLGAAWATATVHRVPPIGMTIPWAYAELRKNDDPPMGAPVLSPEGGAS